ncbi:hypothetical protein PAECIP112173_04548 [Paenibacillus sp. JJ-100]|uniref:hypothetical protein n=1 Tax=Paenibacillus sp. JJ-100 TaxID=2974896 RepID=UPI0022FF9BE2|nr:hypothetical protein [Paenibacillus sp. JJ-100]CAI6085177.1 hypothetical protein PAECIP112173_04548 [Paenibacillus sp. JJ-100]
MLYWLFERVNPIFVVFVLCPLIALILGVCWYATKWCSKAIALGVSLLLPLLYIGSDWGTFIANLDAFFMYGVGYSLVTWGTYRLICTIKGYRL